MGKSQAAAEYATAVVGVLAAEFPELTDPGVASEVRAAVERHVRSPSRAFEVIIDDPAVANWRLRAARDSSGRVRLACYRFGPSAADLDRERRVNEVLDRQLAR